MPYMGYDEVPRSTMFFFSSDVKKRTFSVSISLSAALSDFFFEFFNFFWFFFVFFHFFDFFLHFFIFHQKKSYVRQAHIHQYFSASGTDD